MSVLQAYYTLCYFTVACKPGTSSRFGDNCLPCRVNTYQPQYGAFRCLSCPEGHHTFKTGASNRNLCKMRVRKHNDSMEIVPTKGNVQKSR